jgi:pimeloyl-ACP methyl ester carboxylesterase
MRRGFIPARPLPDGPGGRLLKEDRHLTLERLEAGLVVCLDGVGGYDWLPRLLRRGLDQGGVRGALVIYHWSVGPLGMWVSDLVLRRRNRQSARHAAETIAAYRAWMPGRPVTLIGHSGGGAVAAWTLEAMDEGCQVDRALLLAPALSPQYNLAPALRGVRERMYVCYSWLDIPLLGLGTLVFGTMDGRHAASAGMVGFRMPANLDLAGRQAYEKVRQIRWRPAMVCDGHFGDHSGCTNTRFSRRVLAPIVRGLSDPGEPMERV